MLRMEEGSVSDLRREKADKARCFESPAARERTDGRREVEVESSWEGEVERQRSGKYEENRRTRKRGGMDVRGAGIVELRD